MRIEIILSYLCILPASFAILEGPNICTRYQPYSTTVTVTELQPYQTERKNRCSSLTSRCSKHEIKFRTVYKTQDLLKMRPVKECCEGYTLNAAENTCLPVCTKDCQHGKCVAPDTCECDTGYLGPHCNFHMSILGIQGTELRSECQCHNGGQCDLRTGECICNDGWTGPVCKTSCSSGFWGHNCSMRCECYNGGYCNHVNGSCRCQPGFQGKKCLDTCPYGRFGIDCKGKCTCPNDARCSNIDGTCTCDGWSGDRCNVKTCPGGFYGPKCEYDCQCHKNNTEKCDPTTGKCECKAGWRSKDCSVVCASSTFGKGCLEKCQCSYNAYCSPINGTCACLPGFKEKNCEIPVDSNFDENGDQNCVCKYGESCNSTKVCLEGDHCPEPCECDSDIFICHPTDGWICKQGLTGENCNTTEKVETPIVILGTIVCIFLVMVIFIILYYRRRVYKLKSKMVHSINDSGYCENAVYYYRDGNRAVEQGLLNNTKIIINNLHKPINTNIDMTSSHIASSTSNIKCLAKENYDRSTEMSRFLKNGNVDTTNSDSNHNTSKFDSIYDEIKQNDVEDVGSYDSNLDERRSRKNEYVDTTIDHVYDEIRESEVKGSDNRYDHLEFTLHPKYSRVPYQIQLMANSQDSTYIDKK